VKSTSPLLVVTGTGTGIGKTHVTAALLLAWAEALRAAGVAQPAIAGLKPVESGVTPGLPTDVSTLEQASTFHVKRSAPPYLLARPVSPHLAARAEARTIELAAIHAYVEGVRGDVHGAAVELPGGLFSPLAPRLFNVDVAAALHPTAVLLVAPDRLGVLHDVGAATRAAAAVGLAISGVVLVEPEVRDTSTGTNAAELGLVTDVPVLAVVPRATVEELSRRPDIATLVRDLLVATATA
jgi:dethiobiotin synthetase